MSADRVETNLVEGVSIIVPTFREQANVLPLYEAVRHVLSEKLPQLDWELLFIDDNSDDGTADTVRALAREDRRVRGVQRYGRRGLSSAVVEGAFAATFDSLVIMDGDLQHDPKYIPDLLAPLLDQSADMTAASRFLGEASADGLSSKARVRQSEAGNGLVRRLFGLDLTDPLTGFFATNRTLVIEAAPRLSSMGFKILLDLIVSTKPRPCIREVPFVFAKRQAGESKLDNKVLYDFMLFVLDKKVPGVSLLSPRFVSFGIVGGSGVLVHMAIMSMIILAFTGSLTAEASTLQFSVAQLMGAITAMVWNFIVNNILTYNDRRLSGWLFWRGLLLFMALSSVGLAANVGVATAVNDAFTLNWSIAALAGILVGTVWNYVTTRRFVWNDKAT